MTHPRLQYCLPITAAHVLNHPPSRSHLHHHCLSSTVISLDVAFRDYIIFTRLRSDIFITDTLIVLSVGSLA